MTYPNYLLLRNVLFPNHLNFCSVIFVRFYSVSFYFPTSYYLSRSHLTTVICCCCFIIHILQSFAFCHLWWRLTFRYLPERGIRSGGKKGVTNSNKGHGTSRNVLWFIRLQVHKLSVRWGPNSSQLVLRCQSIKRGQDIDILRDLVKGRYRRFLKTPCINTLLSRGIASCKPFEDPVVLGPPNQWQQIRLEAWDHLLSCSSWRVGRNWFLGEVPSDTGEYCLKTSYSP